MKHNRITHNSCISVIFRILGFHLLFFGVILLFGYLLPKFFCGFPWLQLDLVIFLVMVFILYYFRFVQIKLWKQFFFEAPHHPFEKKLESIIQKALHHFHLLEKRVGLLFLVYFFAIVAFIMFMFFSSIITLLVEVYWLTDSSLKSDLSFSFLIVFMIVSEIIFVLIGWLSNIKETNTNEKQVL